MAKNQKDKLNEDIWKKIKKQLNSIQTGERNMNPSAKRLLRRHVDDVFSKFVNIQDEDMRQNLMKGFFTKNNLVTKGDSKFRKAVDIVIKEREAEYENRKLSHVNNERIKARKFKNYVAEPFKEHFNKKVELRKELEIFYNNLTEIIDKGVHRPKFEQKIKERTEDWFSSITSNDNVTNEIKDFLESVPENDRVNIYDKFIEVISNEREVEEYKNLTSDEILKLIRMASLDPKSDLKLLSNLIKSSRKNVNNSKSDGKVRKPRWSNSLKEVNDLRERERSKNKTTF